MNDFQVFQSKWSPHTIQWKKKTLTRLKKKLNEIKRIDENETKFKPFVLKLKIYLRGGGREEGGGRGIGKVVGEVVVGNYKKN